MQNLPEKIKIMKEGGRMLTEIMKTVLSHIHVGTSGFDLEKIFEGELKKYGVQSAFKGFEGYPYHLCIGINDMVVHGFPSAKKLVEGDLVSVDMGLIHKGWYSDMTRTVVVGKDIHGYQKFINTVKKAHFASVAQAKVGNKVGDMAAASQEIVEVQNSYGVVREMVGHGVGERLHMSPDIPGYGKKNTGPILKEFQTLAVEIIAIKHPNPAITNAKDGWQTHSATGEVCAIYENSLYVGQQGGVLLTGTLE
ncbi:type I methionyl aminopeptidase [bacterium]|nr:type I methionyl aminopeptidase [bacterium]